MGIRHKAGCIFRLAGLAVLLIFLVPFAAASADNSHSINNDKWSGRLTHLTWVNDIKTDFGLDFDSGEYIIGFIPKPGLRMEVGYEISTEGDFDLDIRTANLPAGMSVDARIPVDYDGLYREKYSNDDSLSGRLVVGATGPARVKGHFRSTLKLTVSTTKGLTAICEPEVTFTSIEPADKNQETLVFVAVDVGKDVSLGEVNWMDLRFGPILKGTIGYAGGTKASATRTADEWASAAYLEDDVESIDSCTENGREGCVHGKIVQVKETHVRLTGDLTVDLAGSRFHLFHEDWADNSASEGNARKYTQSLTWKEKLKYQEYCSHLYYKVPVAVWGNENKTQPLKGVYVHKEGYVGADANVTQYAYAKTGSNPTVPDPDKNGKVNLYLPYINGTHTITVDRYNSDPQYRNMSGTGTQPTPMRRGANDQVDIVLGSAEKTQYSVRKEWDIDLENNDKPESIDVLLQAQHYNTGFFTWEGVQKLTLDSGNNWSATFDEVPKYEFNDKGETVKIKYRIRELKPEPEGGDQPAAGGEAADVLNDLVNDVDAVGEVVQNADGLLHPDNGALADESKRVVPARWDLDNVHVWEVVKKRATDWNELWQINPSMSYLTGLASAAVFPLPTVSYKVPQYTNMANETVEEHQTKYVVDYTENGSTTVIKNTAVLDFSMYKRWFMPNVPEEERPESVYLVLCYRVKEEYRDRLGNKAAEKVAGLWIPVIKPLYGNKLNILNLVGLDTLAKFDFAKLLTIPVAVGEAKKGKDGENPLVAWRVKFGVKKYGFLTVPGIPVEFQAQELSSVIVTDLLKFATGYDIPLSFSLNPFSGDKYFTVPGFPMKLPAINKDWEYTCNILNIWLDIDWGQAIGGVKTWVGDTEAQRPDTLTIVIREKTGEREETQEVGRVTLNKSDYKGENAWAWGLRESDLPEGKTLDTNKTYLISEEYPEGYAYKDQYVLAVDGHDLTNTWADNVRVVIRKEYDVDLSGTTNYYPDAIKYKVNGGEYTLASPWKQTGGNYQPSEDVVTLWDGSGSGLPQGNTYKVPGLKKWDLARLEIGETCTYNSGRPAGQQPEFYPSLRGPVIASEKDENGKTTVTYTYTVTNGVQRPAAIRLAKTWKGDEAAREQRPDSVTLLLKRNGETIHTAVIPKADQDTWDYGTTIDKDPAGRPLMVYDPQTKKPYSYSLEENGALEGYSGTYSAKKTDSREKTDISLTYENTYVGATIKVEVRKNWEKRESDILPESIRIRVIAGDSPAIGPDGEYVEDTIRESNGWSCRFTGLPQYDEQGNEIAYSVIEAEIAENGSVKEPDYTPDYGEPSYDPETRTWTCDIYNSYVMAGVGVAKAWKDNDNELGIRPGSVTVYLMTREGEEEYFTRQLDLNPENAWTGVFGRVPLEKPDGTPIEYTIKEDPVEGYGAPEVTGSVQEGFTVTNTPDDTYMNIPVSKVWQGDTGREADRPDKVDLRLMNGQEEAASLTLYAADGWKSVFRGLRRRDAEGKDIPYTLEEVKADGYETAQVTGSPEEGFTVTNAFSGKTAVTVTKVWETYGFAEVPDRVPFGLNRRIEGQDPGTPVFPGLLFLRKSENWTRTFEGLDKYDPDGNEYEYYAIESAYIGYKPTITSTRDDTGWNITITNRPEKRMLYLTKVWDDDDNASGKRPDTVTVRILADGTETKSVQIGPGGKNQLEVPTFREDGETIIQYTIREDAVDGYVSAVTGDMGSGFTITNTLERESKDIKVTKEWEDDEDAFHNRPEAVTLRLWADGEELFAREMRPDAEGKWSYTFAGMPVLAMDEDHQAVIPKRAIVYTVTEDPVPGYDTEINGMTITNTLRRIGVRADKKWDDRDDEDHLRPTSVTADLYMDGERIEKYTHSITIPFWRHVFEDLPSHRNGKEIEYDVGEKEISGYTAEITGSAEDGFTITNKHLPKKRDIAVRKEWLDQEADHPDAVEVILLSDGRSEGEYHEVRRAEITGPDWTYTFEGLPAYTARGQEIHYQVKETVPEGYEDPFITESSESLYIIQNYKTQTTTITGQKTWDDDGNRDGLRPDAVTVHLMKGQEVVATQTVTEADGWAYAFPDVPEYEKGEIIQYTVDEEPVPGYVTVADGTDITNVRVTDRISVRVDKVWDDEDDLEGFRPDAVTILLRSNGGLAGYCVLNEANGWTHTWENLPMNEGGTPVSYRLTEFDAEGYDASIVAEGYDAESGLWKWKITNTHKVSRIALHGEKTWDDDGNRDGLRPEAVTVRLMKGQEVVGARTVTEADDWMYEFTGLPKYEKGEEIQYTLYEEPVPGYAAVIDGMDITNIRVPEKVNIRVTKAWDDGDNRDGLRPETVRIVLRADGGLAGSCVLSEENGWTHTWENLPMNEGGLPVAYRLAESDVEGYTPVYRPESYDPDTATWDWSVTNVHEVRRVTISGQKTWDDEDNRDGLRPDAITVYLMKGQEIVATQTVTEADGWEFAFRDVPEYEQGEKIQYTVAEEPVQGYVTVTDGRHIINIRVPEQADIQVTKTWDDEDDLEGFRPDAVTILLRGNGGSVGYCVLNEENDWTYTWEDLPMNEGGMPISYRLTEFDVEGYEAEVRPEGYDTITGAWRWRAVNTHKVSRITLEGKKTWDDEDNRAGLRPEAITVRLMKGQEAAAVQTVTEKDGWKYAFAGLPKYEKGEEIQYTLSEDPVPGYAAVIDGMDITNICVPEKVNIRVTKAWDDEDNRDGLRPETVTVILRGNGGLAGSCVLSEENGWTHTWEDLPMNEGGMPISYLLAEYDVEGYTPVYRPESFDPDTATWDWSVTNVHEIRRVTVSGAKIWDDRDDREGVRPDSVTVNLFADGLKAAAQEVSAEDGWVYSFKDLPEQAGGREIAYTVDEEPVAGYAKAIDGRTILNRLAPKYTITYDPNGGLLDGSPDPVSSVHAAGEEITIREAPEREGYFFLYWKGSAYRPGDLYTVTEDHTFTAQWERPDPGPSYDFRFSFTKKWQGGHEDSIDWTLYDPEGNVVHKKFNKNVVSETEWQYEAWFVSENDYYIIENVPVGYLVRYENVGDHADVTDRCYNGGRIINYRIPKTGDSSNPLLWAGCVLLGLLGLWGVRRKTRAKRRQGLK